MTLPELEAFFDDQRILTLVLIRCHPEGWQIAARVPVGAPMHLPEAGRLDSSRTFRAATIEGCLDEMRRDAEERSAPAPSIFD
jgi:hypothetical protein